MYYAFSCNTLNTDKTHSLVLQRSVPLNLHSITGRWKAINTNVMSVGNRQRALRASVAQGRKGGRRNFDASHLGNVCIVMLQRVCPKKDRVDTEIQENDTHGVEGEKGVYT